MTIITSVVRRLTSIGKTYSAIGFFSGIRNDNIIIEAELQNIVVVSTKIAMHVKTAVDCSLLI